MATDFGLRPLVLAELLPLEGGFSGFRMFRTKGGQPTRWERHRYRRQLQIPGNTTDKWEPQRGHSKPSYSQRPWESMTSPEESAEWKEQSLGNKHLASHQIPNCYNKMAEGADKRYWHKDKKAPQNAWWVPPQGRRPETRDQWVHQEDAPRRQGAKLIPQTIEMGKSSCSWHNLTHNSRASATCRAHMEHHRGNKKAVVIVVAVP